MNTQQIAVETIRDPLSQVRAALDDFDSRIEPLKIAADSLRAVAVSAGQAARPDAQHCANLLARILEILVWSGEGKERTSFQGAEEIAAFTLAATCTMRAALEDQPGADQQIGETISEAWVRWGEWLEVMDEHEESESTERWPDSLHDTACSQTGCDSEEDEDALAFAAPSADELKRLVDALAAPPQPTNVHENVVPALPGESKPGRSAAAEVVAEPRGGPQSGLHESLPCREEESSKRRLQPPRVQKIALEPDLLEAYLDDAVRCLAALEAAALRLEEEPHDLRSLQQLCRELHTIKGASASVGLNDLASYLHAVEESLQAASESPSVSVDVAQVLTSVDTIRDHIGQLEEDSPPDRSSNPDARREPHGSEPRAHQAFEDGNREAEETLRIKASQLDRLMDMLAELVMLRNRRESRVAELQTFNDDLLQCAGKLRVEADTMERAAVTRERHPLHEIASDLLETTRNQRDICQRVSEENAFISGFIRNFRQELTELQRLPVAGLFLRLQRAVRDAAHREGKRVRLQMLGEHAGLKRTLQERLYEPLLHIVRNAVSHGIESEAARIAAGKDPVGTIVLEALGGSNLLILEIRDDGKGLDYDAIRRRGVEKGLIAPQQPTRHEELAQLIFHPGFSTKTESSAVSGRGIGMDVVAESLNRLRSWVDVESMPNEGTRIRLSIPLRSVIEHTMVFRAGRQLFAVPMQFVHGAGDARLAETTACRDAVVANTCHANDSPGANLPAIHISEFFGDAMPTEGSSGQRLVLGYSRRLLADNRSGPAPDSSFANRGRRFELHVDEIIGPEEVVVRPLPPILRHQEMFSGVTLSGRGKVVLLFDSRRLIDLGLRHAHPPDRGSSGAIGDGPGPLGPTTSGPCRTGHARSHAAPNGRKQVLVVDDSSSARRNLVRLLRQHGVETTEAGDGIEALAQLQGRDIAAVFSDLDMPRMGGLELLGEIAVRHSANPPPVVVVSSREEETIQNEARERGAHAYLLKPAVDSQIASIVKELGLAHNPPARGESN